MGWWLPPVAAMASAALLWAAFFPLNVGWLAWVALVPRLLLVKLPVRSFVGRLWLYGWEWLGGLAFFVAALSWMGSAYHPAMKLAWVSLALYCSFYAPVELWLTRRLDRAGWPIALSVPTVLVAAEWLRSWLITGFAWYYLAHTQHAYLPVIQIADLGGAYAVSALLAAVNAVLAAWAWHAIQSSTEQAIGGLPPPDAGASGSPVPASGGGSPPIASLRLQTATVAVALTLTFVYGFWRLGHGPAEEGPVVALLQGDQSQRARNDGTHESKQALLDQYVARAMRIARDTIPPPDLIVWPETSYPVPWYVAGASLTPDQTLARQASDLRYSRQMTEELTTRILAGRSAVLLGMTTYVFEADGKETRHNSAVLVDRYGVPAGRYDKIHCVPFGEYVPLYREWPAVAALTPLPAEYGLTPGREATRLSLVDAGGRSWRIGALICYEDSDPALSRRFVTDEPVDFLVNLTDDAWFDGSCEPEQHLALARFRAIECRRPLLRAVHLGVSAIIDGDGRVTATPGPTWAASKSVAGEVVAAVPLDGRWSGYAVWGDWPLVACWLAIGVGIVLGNRRRAGQNPPVVAA